MRSTGGAIRPALVAATALTVTAAAGIALAVLAPGAAHPFRHPAWCLTAVAAIAVGVERAWRSAARPRPDATAAAPGTATAPAGLGAPGLGVAGLVVALALLYGPALSLPLLDEEDYYHLILVRHPRTVGWAQGLAPALEYLAGHPGMLIQCLALPAWWVVDAVVGGRDAGFRLVGVASHGLACWLVARLGVRLGLGASGAAAATLLAATLYAVRPVVRDPTGYSELLLGLLYVGAALAWTERALAPARRRRDALVGWLWVLPLVLVRAHASTLPVAVLALVALRRAALPASERPRPWRTVLGRLTPLALVPVLQVALAAAELLLDPTSGRPGATEPYGEFGRMAVGLLPTQLVPALLRDLPRIFLLPVWDKAREVAWAPSVLGGALAFAALGLGQPYRHGGRPLAAAAVLTLVPATVALPFTTWEGPANAHLLYVPLLGAALLAGAWLDSLPARRRRIGAALLAPFLGAQTLLHLRAVSAEHRTGAQLAAAQPWFDRFDDAARAGETVLLVGGTDAGTSRWRRLLLARHLAAGGLRARYELHADVGWAGADPPATAPRPPPRGVVLGWPEAGGPPVVLDASSPLPEGVRPLGSAPPDVLAHCAARPLLARQPRGVLCGLAEPVVVATVERLLRSM